MQYSNSFCNRRSALKGLALGAAASLAPGVFAEELTITPPLMEGPFYPTKMPLDTDNDLLIINDSITPAVGQITHLTGRILSSSGEPIRNAFVEIWQVDDHGVYLHPGSENHDQADKNFQGYGRFLTDSAGRYYFRTIKPVAYPVRPAPHIHFGISKNGQRIFTTQMFVNGHPGNAKDPLFREIDEQLARQTILVDFKPLPNSRLKELSANFDIVLGVTPADPEDESVKGGIGHSAENDGRSRGRGRRPSDR